MASFLAVLRSGWVRGTFLLLALAAAVWAVASRWGEVQQALGAIPPWVIGVGFAASLGYVALTMMSWRVLLAELGSPLSLRDSAHLFFVSQVGKYLPGGVWNVLAAAEMGADLHIPRRRSVSVMAVSMLVAIVTGLLLAAGTVVLAPPDVRQQYGWVAWAFPLFAVALLPPVLTRLLRLMLRLTRRPAPDEPIRLRAVGLASLWALLAWAVVGLQVWLLVTAVGMEATAGTYAQTVGGYALAWTAGLLVVVVPAGVGVREVVLAAVLAGSVGDAGVVVAVLLSRVLLTVADLLLGSGAALYLRRRSPSPARAPQPDH